MEKDLYIDASHPDEIRVVLKSENQIEEYEYENKNKLYLKNNIYLGKVSRIEPSLQAAFIDFGRDRHGFLSFNDIQSDYYQIPKSDLEKSVSAFRELMKVQLERVETIKSGQEWMDYGSKSPLVIGVCWGDGIGESISKQAQRVLEHVLNPVEFSSEIYRVLLNKFPDAELLDVKLENEGDNND